MRLTALPVRQHAADGRRDLARGGDRPGHRGSGKHAPTPALDARLGEAHPLDHEFVRLVRRVPEGEEPVLEQNQAFRLRMGVRGRLRGLRKIEPRHDVRDDRRAVAVHFAADLLPIGLIRENERRVGVRMIDERARHPRVQQRLHRRVRRRRVEQVAALQVDHVLVGQGLDLCQPQKRIELHRGKAGRFDRPHVPAAPLHVQHVQFRSGHVPGAALDRRVAPAVHHEPRLGPQEPRRVHPQREILPDALGGVPFDELRRLALAPRAFHLMIPLVEPCRTAGEDGTDLAASRPAPEMVTRGREPDTRRSPRRA